jgi:hypothetical protein
LPLPFPSFLVHCPDSSWSLGEINFPSFIVVGALPVGLPPGDLRDVGDLDRGRGWGHATANSDGKIRGQSRGRAARHSLRQTRRMSQLCRGLPWDPDNLATCGIFTRFITRFAWATRWRMGSIWPTTCYAPRSSLDDNRAGNL